MMSAVTNLSPILIAGPTASGKSALALNVAERIGGTIINADSMQVYSELRILTARPSAEEEARVPHRLYGHVPAREAYSAGRFVVEAAEAIAGAQAEGRRAIIVGGTGLYFKALLEGLSPIPAVKEDVRAHWRQEAERLGAKALHAVLFQRDPEMAARLAPSDTQRLVRALEVLDSSGQSLAHWQSLPGTPVIDARNAVKLLVTRPREDLRARAGQRFDEMLEEGALEEVRALAAMQLDPALPAMRALGVRPLLAHLRAALSLDDAVSAAKLETRQFIKRQETWLRGHMITFKDISTQDMERIDATVMPFIHS